jgi:CO/xanthine dehydrogenase FAD-binding subunit
MKLGKLSRNTTLHLAGGRVVIPAGTLVKVCWKTLPKGVVFKETKTIVKTVKVPVQKDNKIFYETKVIDRREVEVPVRAVARAEVLEFIGFGWLGGFIRAPHDGRVYQVDLETGEVIGLVEFPEFQQKGECYPFTMLTRNTTR